MKKESAHYSQCKMKSQLSLLNSKSGKFNSTFNRKRKMDQLTSVNLTSRKINSVFSDLKWKNRLNIVNSKWNKLTQSCQLKTRKKILSLLSYYPQFRMKKWFYYSLLQWIQNSSHSQFKSTHYAQFKMNKSQFIFLYWKTVCDWNWVLPPRRTRPEQARARTWRTTCRPSQRDTLQRGPCSESASPCSGSSR